MFAKISPGPPVPIVSLVTAVAHSASSDIWFLSPWCWTVISWSALRTKQFYMPHIIIPVWIITFYNSKSPHLGTKTPMNMIECVPRKGRKGDHLNQIILLFRKWLFIYVPVLGFSFIISRVAELLLAWIPAVDSLALYRYVGDYLHLSSNKSLDTKLHLSVSSLFSEQKKFIRVGIGLKKGYFKS